MNKTLRIYNPSDKSKHKPSFFKRDINRIHNLVKSTLDATTAPISPLSNGKIPCLEI